MAKKKNNVIELYDLVAANLWQTISWTPNKGGWIWSDFWSLLVSGGVRFEKESLIELQKSCRSEDNSWGHLFHGPNEGHYSQAVMCGNISFANAYENFVGRKPFILKGIEYHAGGSVRNYQSGTTSKTQGRLIIGASFQWKGETVFVTNFKDKDHALIACAYEREKKGYGWSSKITRRFTITNEQLRAEKNNAAKKTQSGSEAENGEKETEPCAPKE